MRDQTCRTVAMVDRGHGGNARGVIAFILLLAVGAADSLGAQAALRGMPDDPNQWVMPNGNNFGWNYSPLDQINLGNVHNLSVAWTLQLGVLDSYQASPLVIGDVMYVVTPKPNRVYALDLTRGGVILWEYRADSPDWDLARQRSCCGALTRGLAYADGKVFLNTPDGDVIALDAVTGTQVWTAKNSDISRAETMTAAPFVVNDNLVVGVAGGEWGVQGHVTAYDIRTGQQKWRFYSMGPNDQVGIGPHFRPLDEDDRLPQPGLDTWFGDSWKRGGATIWGWFSYDPELNLFYYGTANCGPWNPDYRREWGVLDIDDRGIVTKYRNNYCSSIMARDGNTGELIWARNLTPQDQWDLDEPNMNILADLRINGQMRRALIRPARNGYFYVMDRATGELLTQPWMFVYNDIFLGVDMPSGRPRYDIRKMMFSSVEDRRRYVPDAQNALVEWCPGISARNWQNDAYSPRTGLVYSPTSNNCGRMTVIERDYVPGEDYQLRIMGPGQADPPPGTTHAGELQANDPVTGRTVWRILWDSGNNVPVMATAGDLLFQGGPNEGVFRAFDARTGEIVWSFRTGSNFQSSAISYVGPDGRQYVAVIGSGADSPEVSVNTSPTAAGRFRRAGATLYVFALPPGLAGGAQ